MHDFNFLIILLCYLGSPNSVMRLVVVVSSFNSCVTIWCWNVLRRRVLWCKFRRLFYKADHVVVYMRANVNVAVVVTVHITINTNNISNVVVCYFVCWIHQVLIVSRKRRSSEASLNFNHWNTCKLTQRTTWTQLKYEVQVVNVRLCVSSITIENSFFQKPFFQKFIPQTHKKLDFWFLQKKSFF